jgi:AraC-like DNA-binding protein
MEISFVEPKSIELRNYVEYFYVAKIRPQESIKYFAFPHYNTCLSIVKGVTINRAPSHIKIEANTSESVTIEFFGKYVKPILMEYNGKCEEVSIVFKPLGVHYFHNGLFKMPEASSSKMIHDTGWVELMSLISFENPDFQKLEDFLLSKIAGCEQLDKLALLTEYFLKEGPEKSIASLAFDFGYSPKSLYRHFMKFLGCSPIEFKRICRFRNVLQAENGLNRRQSLVGLAYDYGYFDQAHFIKEFKKLSHHNPKKFFNSVKKLGEGRLLWHFL